MLILLDAAPSKNKLVKDFKPIKKIYKHCGLIREGYINLQMGAHYGLENGEFIAMQVNEMERGISELRANAKKYLKIIKAVHDKLEESLGAIADESISEFYKTELEQIAAALNKLQFDDTLHNCRKQVKTLLYNRKIAASALDGKLIIDNSYLDKLQGRIGDWHDNTLAIELFSDITNIDKPIINRLKRENTRLKKSINLLAHGFWKKTVLTENGLDSGQAANVWV